MWSRYVGSKIKVQSRYSEGLYWRPNTVAQNCSNAPKEKVIYVFLWSNVCTIVLCRPLWRKLRPLSLEAIENWINIGRLDASKPITMKALQDAGISGWEEGFEVIAQVRTN